MPKPWGYWIFAGGLFFSFIFILKKTNTKTPTISPNFSWIPKQTALVSPWCNFPPTLPGLPVHPPAPLPAVLPTWTAQESSPWRFHDAGGRTRAPGVLQRGKRLPCEPPTNAHGSKVFANVPEGRPSAGADNQPQDTDPPEINLHPCWGSWSYFAS